MSAVQSTSDSQVEWVDDRALAARTPIARVTWQLKRRTGDGPPYYQIGRRILYK